MSGTKSPHLSCLARARFNARLVSSSCNLIASLPTRCDGGYDEPDRQADDGHSRSDCRVRNGDPPRTPDGRHCAGEGRRPDGRPAEAGDGCNCRRHPGAAGGGRKFPVDCQERRLQRGNSAECFEGRCKSRARDTMTIGSCFGQHNRAIDRRCSILPAHRCSRAKWRDRCFR